MTLHVVTMCTHNRTRSVLMGALLGPHLSAAGVEASIVTAGIVADDFPATSTTVRLLRDRGIDVSGHRSTVIDETIVSAADLVVTAEKQHVVFVGGRWAGSFERAFTLPELVQRGEAVGGRRGASMAMWLAAVNERRPAGYDYLDDPMVPEIADPTGQSPVVWAAAFAEIDQLCGRLARLLA
jgi:protein-tyrosine phosphatase